LLKTELEFLTGSFLNEPGFEEAAMLEAQTYRQYAADCIRIAEKMDPKDKQILLKIAEAWKMRAEEAERRKSKTNGKE
jgi:hypothetical protein